MLLQLPDTLRDDLVKRFDGFAGSESERTQRGRQAERPAMDPSQSLPPR